MKEVKKHLNEKRKLIYNSDKIYVAFMRTKHIFHFDIDFILSYCKHRSL